MDTDILVDAERGVTDAVSLLAAQQMSAGVQLSTVSAMELIVGCRNQLELANVVKSLSNAVIHELSPTGSMQARQWVEKFWLSHSLQLADALIAATAAELQLPLYTKNVRHFQMLPGLTAIRPY